MTPSRVVLEYFANVQGTTGLLEGRGIGGRRLNEFVLLDIGFPPSSPAGYFFSVLPD